MQMRKQLPIIPYSVTFVGCTLSKKVNTYTSQKINQGHLEFAFGDIIFTQLLVQKKKFTLGTNPKQKTIQMYENHQTTNE